MPFLGPSKALCPALAFQRRREIPGQAGNDGRGPAGNDGNDNRPGGSTGPPVKPGTKKVPRNDLRGTLGWR